MALSNILVEPRREITETAVGLLAVPLFLGPDYFVAYWMEKLLDGPRFKWEGVFVGMLIWPVAVTVLVAIIVVLGLGVHGVGEGVCNFLEKRGIHMRPRQRYTRRV